MSQKIGNLPSNVGPKILERIKFKEKVNPIEQATIVKGTLSVSQIFGFYKVFVIMTSLFQILWEEKKG